MISCDMSHRQAKEYTNLVSYYKNRKDQLLKEAAEKAEAKLKGIKPDDKSLANEILELMGPTGARNLNNEKKKIKSTDDNSSNILMELRKGANHPLLRRCIYDDQKLKEMAKLILKVKMPKSL